MPTKKSLFVCTHVITSDPPHALHTGAFHKARSSYLNLHLDNTMLMAILHDQLHVFLCTYEVYVTKYLLQ